MTIEEYSEKVQAAVRKVQSEFPAEGGLKAELTHIGDLLLEYKKLHLSDRIDEDLIRTAGIYMIVLQFFGIVSETLLEGLGIIQKSLGVVLPPSTDDGPTSPPSTTLH